jgi:hypothetical protein
MKLNKRKLSSLFTLGRGAKPVPEKKSINAKQSVCFVHMFFA